MADVNRQPAMRRLRSATRRGVGRALRASPPPVQDAIRRGSTRLLTALGTPPPAAPAQSTGNPWQPPAPPVPDGTTLAAIEALFRSWSVNSEPVGHLDGYVDDSLWRFLHTWSVVRDARGHCLELGSNPYFTTHLLDTYTGLDLTLANYYGETGTFEETVSFVPERGADRVEQKRAGDTFNVEEDGFPYLDDSFEVVLFCEMLEHLLMNPLATLGQIHRVLKPGGTLVLTTPNVARIDNVMAMVHGVNIYDPYSGYGPYGRHNREYTRHELHRLLDFAGFEVEHSFTADGHTYQPERWPRRAGVEPLIEYRKEDLGHYLFVRAHAVRPPRSGLPSFLYRSYDDDTIVDFS
jgi:SAM-dependent methyltransferase